MKNTVSFLHSVFARRIFVLFVICALLPVSALTVITLWQISRTMTSEGQNRMRHTARNAGMTIVEGLFLLETELRSMAKTIPASSAAAVGGYQIPTSGSDEKRFLGLTVFSEHAVDRQLMGGAAPLPVLTPGNRQHLAAGKVLLIAAPAEHGSRRLFMVAALGQGKPLQRMLVAELNPLYLWELVRHTLPPEMALCIIDSHDSPLFNTAPSLPGFISLATERLRKSSVGYFEWNRSGEDAMVSYWSAFLPPLYMTDTWTVMVSQPKDVLLRPIYQFGRTFLLVICLTLIVVTYLSRNLIRRSLIPLAMLRNGTRQLSQGDFSARVQLHSADEFEELASTFNGMADHLQRQFSTMQETGRIVQQLLPAHNRALIVKTALSSQGGAVPCELMLLSLIDPPASSRAITYRIYRDDAGGDQMLESVTDFTEAELSQFDAHRNHLHLTASSLIPSLQHVTETGIGDFYVFPFYLSGNLAGLLTIGFRDIPPRLQEDVTRARQITDEIAVALDNIRLVEELNQLNRGIIKALSNAVDAKSPWTAGHSERVTELALKTGRAMGLSESYLELLYLAGMFHDIGKISISEAILDKEGALTEEERSLLRSHPEAGAKILNPISAFEQIIPLVVQHHERFDGTGYPAGLAGSDIAVGGRILAVSDVFDAMVSDRPYRPGMERDIVLSYLQENAGKMFDPLVVQTFLGMMSTPSCETIIGTEDVLVNTEVSPI